LNPFYEILQETSIYTNKQVISHAFDCY